MAISANPVLFADDRSMIITKSGAMKFANTINRNIKKKIGSKVIHCH
jgi:hypothetical protein